LTIARAVTIRVSVLVHATEDQARVVKLLWELCPEGFPRKLETASLKGHYGNQIVRIQVLANGTTKSDRLLGKLWASFSEADKKEILSSVENHLDSSGSFHLRLDKQQCSLGRIVLGDSDPVKVEVRFTFHGKPGESIAAGVVEKLEDLQLSESHN
jgi:RNA binding exosome subunit